MASQLETMLQEVMGDLDLCSPDKVEDLLQEAMKTFMALQQKIVSEDPKERDEALQMANALKVAIQAQAEEFSKKAGIDPAEFAAMAENPPIFSPEIAEQLNLAKEKFTKFEAAQPKKSSRHPKKNKSAWIPS